MRPPECPPAPLAAQPEPDPLSKVELVEFDEGSPALEAAALKLAGYSAAALREAGFSSAALEDFSNSWRSKATRQRRKNPISANCL